MIVRYTYNMTLSIVDLRSSLPTGLTDTEIKLKLRRSRQNEHKKLETGEQINLWNEREFI